MLLYNSSIVNECGENMSQIIKNKINLEKFMGFIKQNTLTSLFAVLAIIFWILPSLNGLFLISFGAAAGAFLFEFELASGLANKIRSLLKL